MNLAAFTEINGYPETLPQKALYNLFNKVIE